MAKRKADFDLVGGLITAARRQRWRPTQVEYKTREREQRVENVLKAYELTDLSARKLLRLAHDNSIRIDQIEKRIVVPIAEERALWTDEQRARHNSWVLIKRTIKFIFRVGVIIFILLAVLMFLEK